MKLQGASRDRDAWFAELYAKADQAGRKAAAAVAPKHFGCGFAWVIVNGNSAFGRWVKNHRGWERGYASGMCLSIRDYNPSENHKIAYARAFAAALREAGINARAESRSD
jgi:hypothetical protein